MSKERLFIKIGGSSITDKTRPDSLIEHRVRQIARAISLALSERKIELVLAHGAGSYGHIIAKQFEAVNGIHPQHGWHAFYQIRQDMLQMNVRFVQLCAEQNLFPITIQPSAVITAKAGAIQSMNFNVIKKLLKFRQIPLLHGDIVVDEQLGFTIASTENILTFLSHYLKFDRVIMISDVPGVLDDQGKIIPVIHEKNFNKLVIHLGGAKGADVTGGMKKKVEQLYLLIRHGHIKKALILSCETNAEALKQVILGQEQQGTMIV